MKLFHVRIKMSAPGYKNGYRKGVVGAISRKIAIEETIEMYENAKTETGTGANLQIEVVECKEFKSDFIIVKSK